MMSGETVSIVTTVMNIMATLFVIAVGIGILEVIILSILDITKPRSAIPRN
mgnify:CR=1 FL=1